jgi:hypothetical protein
MFNLPIKKKDNEEETFFYTGNFSELEKHSLHVTQSYNKTLYTTEMYPRSFYSFEVCKNNRELLIKEELLNYNIEIYKAFNEYLQGLKEGSSLDYSLHFSIEKTTKKVFKFNDIAEYVLLAYEGKRDHEKYHYLELYTDKLLNTYIKISEICKLPTESIYTKLAKFTRKKINKYTKQTKLVPFQLES